MRSSQPHVTGCSRAPFARAYRGAIPAFSGGRVPARRGTGLPVRALFSYGYRQVVCSAEWSP